MAWDLESVGAWSYQEVGSGTATVTPALPQA